MATKMYSHSPELQNWSLTMRGSGYLLALYRGYSQHIISPVDGKYSGGCKITHILYIYIYKQKEINISPTCVGSMTKSFMHQKYINQMKPSKLVKKRMINYWIFPVQYNEWLQDAGAEVARRRKKQLPLSYQIRGKNDPKIWSDTQKGHAMRLELTREGLLV